MTTGSDWSKVFSRKATPARIPLAFPTFWNVWNLFSVISQLQRILLENILTPLRSDIAKILAMV
jgi:hypothetical protein